MPNVNVTYPADGVGLIAVDNPPMNFITYALLAEMGEALEEIEEAGARVVVIASDVPGYFMAHAWIPDIIDVFEGGEPSGDPRNWFRVLQELRSGPLVSIAANNGQAWGGGAEISWACNLRIAGESSTYAQPEVLAGMIPGAGGTTRLARIVGEAHCLEIVLDGQPITAQEAQRIGAVNKVVPDVQLREAAIAWGARLASRPAHALAGCKRSVLEGLDLPMEQAVRNEGKILVPIVARPESLEILRSVQAKYDAGADSYEALGLETRPLTSPSAS
ncbi:MAG: enoyl-CoA hydratase/isomerase family protein [Chloroflexi bacterium]|nr:enoyl-CoA hydratase/isomerase family protein [Chloroflexota bacterium]